MVTSPVVPKNQIGYTSMLADYVQCRDRILLIAQFFRNDDKCHVSHVVKALEVVDDNNNDICFSVPRTFGGLI